MALDLDKTDDLLVQATRTEKLNGGGTLESTMLLNPLPYFMPTCWRRHGYSASDIEQTFKSFKSCHLWPHAVMYGIPFDSNCVKAGYGSETQLIWGAKLCVIKHMLRRALAIYPESVTNQNRLFQGTNVHIPKLPIHVISALEFANILAGVGSTVVSWRGIKAVALRPERNGQLLLMNRVIPSETWKKLFQEAESMATEPTEVTDDTGNRWTLLEEAWFFTFDAKLLAFTNKEAPKRRRTKKGQKEKGQKTK